MKPKKQLPWLSIALVTGILVFQPAPGDARKQEITPAPSETRSQLADLAEVDGFRSAKFGFGEKDVMKAIFKDFKITRSKMNVVEHPTEKTTSIGISVTDLLPETGTAQIYYILGYQSKKLMQVNILWGKPVDPTPNAQAVVAAANQLRDHFLRQNFPRKGLVANTPLPDGSILVFRGIDKKRRMAVLVLYNPQKEGDPPNQHINLRLSYIDNPSHPDIFHIKEGDF